ncbi:hypothetical protein BpHYR1_017660 [Brachionus plicatilis]|uniref:HTH psq-type domain-containing protein n=1 Tax=Brachionus plicatilis TaxID=10195 RepID=A0A3M7RAK4_BRAPC|nr:hypothetical protein BpHYR1_017660 [Brachionus plicatilis]
MNENQVCKKRKCTSFEVKIEIIKKYTEQNITTSKLVKEYNAEIVDSIATNNPIEQDSDTEIEEQQDDNK